MAFLDKSFQSLCSGLFFYALYGTLNPMRFLLGYSVFILLFFAQTAFAQESVRVRSGEHDGYSRLVFDWKDRVQYSIEAPSSKKLIIEFEKNAHIKSVPDKINTAINIGGFDVISESPLRVSITIPDGSRTRNFWAGNRVVVDVYNPPGAKRKKTPTITGNTGKKPKTVKTATKKELVTPPKKKPVKEALKPQSKHDDTIDLLKSASISSVEPVHVEAPSEAELKEVSSTVKTSSAAKAESVEKPSPLIEIVQVVNQVAKKQRKSTGSNLIMLSSTKVQGLAVFELNGNIWVVNDQADLRLIPEVRGPDSEKMLPLQIKDIVGGKVFKVKALDGYHVRGQGGGLLWRVLISPEKHELTPVEPFKENVKDGQPRSGKVIWPFKEPGQVLDVEDPVTGVILKVVTMKNSNLLADQDRNFVDFKTIGASVGLVIMPKVDDLEVKITSEGVEVSRPGGLSLLTDEQLAKISAEKVNPQEKVVLAKTPMKLIYDFRNWQMGGVKALAENGMILLSDINDQTEAGRIETLIALAKMYISNAQGAEALGFLRLAQSELPDLGHSPEFIALRGAAKALDWKSELAFADLSSEGLEPFEETGYWRAFVLADLGDWAQAQEVLPQNLDALYDYPALVFDRLALVIAEISLRAANVKQADELLHAVGEHEESLFTQQVAALTYLKGEAARQRGKINETKKFWKLLTTGPDDLYRAKAGLALTRLRVDQKELTPRKAIDKLERLRYAWRGDFLEAQINYWLGKTYFEAEEYAKGLNIMREAASYAAGTSLGGIIAAEMKDAFATLFLSDELSKVPPPDAAALYEQFSELAPTGDAGDKVVEMLADHLVKADLLDRASSLLSHQLDHRLKGSEAYRIGVHLAAIYLLDNQPVKAMNSLGRATSELQKLPEEMQTQERYLEISLLRARAMSQRKRADQALALLSDLPRSPAVNNLRADIAWNASYWDDAAEAFQDIILDRNFSLTRPLAEEDAKLVLQRAVALNLAGDRIALANMREKYTDIMAQTGQARVFDVISRPRQSATLASRETLMGVVSEVDLFSDYMNSYRDKPLSSSVDAEALPKSKEP